MVPRNIKLTVRPKAFSKCKHALGETKRATVTETGFKYLNTSFSVALTPPLLPQIPPASNRVKSQKLRRLGRSTPMV